jgi:hypothetical protein
MFKRKYSPSPLQESLGRLRLDELLLVSELDDEPAAPFQLLIFFHGREGCACLNDWQYWNQLQQLDTLSVKGIFNGVPGEEDLFLKLSRGLGLSFPLYYDNAGLRTTLRVKPGVVTKILLGPDQRVLFKDTNQMDQIDHQYFFDRTLAHIRTY